VCTVATLYQISRKYVPDTNVLTNNKMLPPAPIFGKIVDENQAGAHNEKKREREGA
jgi:hypothetical protein